MQFIHRAALGALVLAPAVASAQTTPAPVGRQPLEATPPQTTPAPGQTTPAPADPGTPAPAPGTPAQGGPTGPATATVGATVYDSAGVSLGTVEQVTPQAVVVNIGTAKVGLPPASIGAGPRGLQVGTTRAAIEAQAQGATQQQLGTQLVAGAAVTGAGGASVGTIKSVAGETVTLTTERGDVNLPRSGFGPGPSGPVIGLTKAQLDEAITQAGGAAPSGAAAGTSAEAGAASTTGADAGAGSTATTTQTRTKRTTTTRPN